MLINKKNDMLKQFFDAAIKGDIISLEKQLSERPLLIHAKDFTGATAFHVAASSGQTEVLLFLIEKGIGRDIALLDYSGNNALDNAINNNQLQTVKFLIELDLHFFDKATNTPLHRAAANGNVNGLQMLLENPNLPEKYQLLNLTNIDGRTPLHLATQNGHLNAIEYLINQGSDVLQKDNKGVSPLAIARAIALQHKNKSVMLLIGKHALHELALTGQDVILEYLIKQKISLAYTTDDGMTPLHCALLNDSPECFHCAQLMLESDNANYTTIDGKILSRTEFVNYADKDGITALHLATSQIESMEYLITEGANPFIKDTDGHSLLHYATRNGDASSIEFAIALLLDPRDPSSIINIINQPNNIGETPLHIAASIGSVSAIEYLHHLGANLFIEDNKKRYPIDRAIYAMRINNTQDTQAIELLHSKGAKTNNKFIWNIFTEDKYASLLQHFMDQDYLITTYYSEGSPHPLPPLYAVAQSPDCLKVMLTHPKAIYACENENVIINKNKFINGEFLDLKPRPYTVLEYAACKGYVKSLALLIENGANLHRHDNWRNASDIAIEFKQMEALSFLLSQGLEPSAREELPALHFLVKKGYIEAIKILLAHFKSTNQLEKMINLKEKSRGATPLHVASNCQQDEIFRLLINEGADINSVDGLNALNYAIKTNHTEMSDLLKDMAKPKVSQQHENPKATQEQPKNATHEKQDEEKSTELDPYVIMGVSRDATFTDIKKIYRKYILKKHPDKISKTSDLHTQLEATEDTAIFNWAYQILSDPGKRKKWDATHDNENETDVNDRPKLTTEEDNLSTIYKNYHAIAEKLFQVQPLVVLLERDKKQAFVEVELDNLANSNVFGEKRYQHLYRTTEGIEFADVYQFIAHTKKYDLHPEPQEKEFLMGSLNPDKAIHLLLLFLEGKLYGNNLQEIQNYYQQELNRCNKTHTSLLAFYAAIKMILDIIDSAKEHQKILQSLEQIYSFAYQGFYHDDATIVKLMQNKYFRYLVADAHSHYWQDANNTFNSGSLLANLKNEYSKKYKSKDKVEKIFLGLEAKMQKAISTSSEKNINDLYEAAYLLIDLSDSHVNSAIRINAAILAGLCFHFAASKETKISKSMASERLALRAYQYALEVAHFSQAPVSLYAASHIAKYISQLTYLHPKSMDTMQCAIKKALYYIDIFPFYNSFKSTFDLQMIELYQMRLVRSLLMDLIDQQKKLTHQESYDYAKVVYQAYDDSLDRWYLEAAETEEQEAEGRDYLKLQAIELRMTKDQNSHHEMEKLIAHPYIHMYRDKEGWLQPVAELDFPAEAKVKIYKSFDGYERDTKTGKANLFMQEWQEGDDPALRLFNDFDLFQMFNLLIKEGRLSLNFADVQQVYNPLFEVKFDPSHLAGTEYLKTLFMIDYLLKMFVTGAEISATPPYKTRKIDNLLAPLPDYLRKSLNLNLYRDYAENHSHKIRAHRLWMSTDEVERQEIKEDDKIKVYYGNVRVVLRCHLLDYLISMADGKLIDSEENDKDNSPEERYTTNFNKFYSEIRHYFPVFHRLEQLVKISGAISELEATHHLQAKVENVPEKICSNLRVPAVYHKFSINDSEDLPSAVYGGVLAYPKFSNKVLGINNTTDGPQRYNLDQTISNYRNNRDSNTNKNSANSTQDANSLWQDPFMIFRTRENKKDGIQNQQQALTIVPSSIRSTTHIAKVLGGKIPTSINRFMMVDHFMARYRSAPQHAGIPEKLIASALGYTAQRVTTDIGTGILISGVTASIALAPETGGVSLYAIPLAIEAAPRVSELGQQVGDIAQQQVHAIFSQISQPKIPYPRQIIETLPKLRKKVHQPGDKIIGIPNYPSTNLTIFQLKIKKKREETDNHATSQLKK